MKEGSVRTVGGLPLLLVCALAPASAAQAPPAMEATELDIVFVGGRVMDPETGLDAVRLTSDTFFSYPAPAGPLFFLITDVGTSGNTGPSEHY